MRSPMRYIRRLEDVVRRQLNLNQPEEQITRDAQAVWDKAHDRPGLWLHVRGSDFYAEDDKWLAIGRRVFNIFEDFARTAQLDLPMQRVVEWGCGGGANAVHFAPHCRHFHGIDVSKVSLDECAKQVAAFPNCTFHPTHIEVARPEAVLQSIEPGVDCFFCVYVAELFPSQDYGMRVVEIGRQLLRVGGMAMIQIKYETDHWKSHPRRWNYAGNFCNMTTYPIHDFWQRCEKTGLTPLSVFLTPQPEEIPDERYAYFCLRRAR